jgi:hypothetical protein
MFPTFATLINVWFYFLHCKIDCLDDIHDLHCCNREQQRNAKYRSNHDEIILSPRVTCGISVPSSFYPSFILHLFAITMFILAFSVSPSYAFVWVASLGNSRSVYDAIDIVTTINSTSSFVITFTHTNVLNVMPRLK